MFWKKNKIKAIKAEIFNLPGSLEEYALNKEGLLFAFIKDNVKIFKTQSSGYSRKTLFGISLKKGIIWRTEISITEVNNQINLPEPNDLKIDKNGFAWTCCFNQLIQIDSSGKIIKRITIYLDEDQEIGKFLILDSGFIVLLQTNINSRKINVKLLRINNNGNLVWETKIIPKVIKNKGITQVTDFENWTPYESPPWEPREWLNLDILVSFDKLVASFFEYSSGIGICYYIDIFTGEIEWETEPDPMPHIICLDNGKLLSGFSGYDSFDTFLYNKKGEIIQKWDIAGNYLISQNNTIFLFSTMYSEPGKLFYFYELLRDGSKKGYFHIRFLNNRSGYNYIFPAIDEFGNIIFWLENELIAVNNNLNEHILFKLDTEKKQLSDRILLSEKGTIICAVENNLIVVKTNLGKLANSPWPCKYGNLERNPVINEKLL